MNLNGRRRNSSGFTGLAGGDFGLRNYNAQGTNGYWWSRTANLFSGNPTSVYLNYQTNELAIFDQTSLNGPLNPLHKKTSNEPLLHTSLSCFLLGLPLGRMSASVSALVKDSFSGGHVWSDGVFRRCSSGRKLSGLVAICHGHDR